MDGQISVWDYLTSITPKRKPYEYSFQRHIGQRIEIYLQGDMKIGIITEIDPYYTIVSVDGEEFVGTALNVYPYETENNQEEKD